MTKKIMVLLMMLVLAGGALAELAPSCSRCSGNGKCWNCSGTGVSSSSSCFTCSGTGKCYYCSGKGTT